MRDEEISSKNKISESNIEEKSQVTPNKMVNFMRKLKLIIGKSE